MLLSQSFGPTFLTISESTTSKYAVPHAIRNKRQKSMMPTNPRTATNIQTATSCSRASVARSCERSAPSISLNRSRLRSRDSISRSCSRISRGMPVTHEGSEKFISQLVSGRRLVRGVIQVIFFTSRLGISDAKPRWNNSRIAAKAILRQLWLSQYESSAGGVFDLVAPVNQLELCIEPVNQLEAGHGHRSP